MCILGGPVGWEAMQKAGTGWVLERHLQAGSVEKGCPLTWPPGR